MTPELVVFTGLQASGKTTFYRERFAATHVHVSKDAWPNARKKEERQRRLVDEHLRAGRSVVVDNTNPTPVEREALIAIARAIGARVSSYSFVVTVEEALRRNASRVGRAQIEPAGIYAVANKLVVPAAAEGFDQRFEVRLTEAGFVVAVVVGGRRGDGQPWVDGQDVPSPIDLRDATDAANWAASAEVLRPHRFEVRAAIAELLRAMSAPRSRVLELGPGPGLLAQVVLERCEVESYTLFDFSEPMLEMCRMRVGHDPAVRFVVGDFTRADWAGSLVAPFDAVVAMQAVHEVRHKRHVARLYGQVHELLRPGGMLVCVITSRRRTMHGWRRCTRRCRSSTPRWPPRATSRSPRIGRCTVSTCAPDVVQRRSAGRPACLISVSQKVRCRRTYWTWNSSIRGGRCLKMASVLAGMASAKSGQLVRTSHRVGRRARRGRDRRRNSFAAFLRAHNA